jgi:hypothetical protein
MKRKAVTEESRSTAVLPKVGVKVDCKIASKLGYAVGGYVGRWI